VSTLTSQIKDMSPVVILRASCFCAGRRRSRHAWWPGLDSIATLGAENILPSVESALARAIELRRAIAW